MSEVVKPSFESSIERTNKKLVVNIGTKAVVFDYLNTILYEHSKKYSIFDHAFRLNDDRRTGDFYLRSGLDDLWNKLVVMDFPRRFEPYPSLTDEETIMRFHMDNLDTAWEQFNGGSE